MGREKTELVRGTPLIIFAVKEEAAPFKKAGLATIRAEVSICGMGATNADRATRAAISELRPSIIITAGYAGALKPQLRRGQVLFDADPSFPNPERFRTAGAFPAQFVCVPRVASSAEAKRKIAAETHADALEMESGVIRLIARQEGIPSATVRVILDELEQDLPMDFNTVLTRDCRINGLKLAAFLAANPGKVPRLLEFQKQARYAAEALGRVLTLSLTSAAPEK